MKLVHTIMTCGYYLIMINIMTNVNAYMIHTIVMMLYTNSDIVHIMVMCCVFLQKNDTPLHFASSYGHTAVVDQLIRYGAAINQRNDVCLVYYEFIATN